MSYERFAGVVIHSALSFKWNSNVIKVHDGNNFELEYWNHKHAKFLIYSRPISLTIVASHTIRELYWNMALLGMICTSKLLEISISHLFTLIWWPLEWTRIICLKFQDMKHAMISNVFSCALDSIMSTLRKVRNGSNIF